MSKTQFCTLFFDHPLPNINLFEHKNLLKTDIAKWRKKKITRKATYRAVIAAEAEFGEAQPKLGLRLRVEEGGKIEDKANLSCTEAEI